jgi:outer membrane autotransporter protein
MGVTGGVEYDSGNAVLGLAVNYSRPKADMLTGTGDVRAKGWQVGVYGGWTGGGAFVEGWAGHGWLDYDIDREAVIDRIAAETDGTAITAGAKAGYLFPLGGLSVGPVAGINYAKAELDPYTETGDPVLTLNVEDQDVSALVGSAGVEARGSFDSGGLAVSPYVALTAEKDFKGDGRIIRYAGTASPTIVNSFVLAERSEDTYGRLTAGASLALGGSFALQIQGSTSFEQDGSDDVAGWVGLKVGF